jgi:WD40 repeat protein
MDAKLFDGIEFNPRHPQPPPYIKVRSKFKKEKEFDRVFLAQELRASGAAGPLKRTPTINYPSSSGIASQLDDEDTIWALEFSKDGRYLASGGQDKIVRVWAVISTSEERRQHEREEQHKHNGTGSPRMSAAVFQSSVYREYDGHEGAVIDLSWSKVSRFSVVSNHQADRSRTTSYSRPPQIRQFDCGMSAEQNACAPSSTTSTSCQCNSTHETIDSSLLAPVIANSAFGASQIKVSLSTDRVRRSSQRFRSHQMERLQLRELSMASATSTKLKA